MHVVHVAIDASCLKYNDMHAGSIVLSDAHVEQCGAEEPVHLILPVHF